MKFIYKTDSQKIQETYWDSCEKEKLPYIVLTKMGKDYTNIFYDITSFDVELECISDEIKTIYNVYLNFFLESESINSVNESGYYFFNFVVKADHAEYIANQLHDYLLSYLK